MKSRTPRLSLSELCIGVKGAVGQEPGNLWFEWSRSVDVPDQFVLIEAFRDAAAGGEHEASD
jgi:quinol monooxygenase YgiN